MSARRAYLGDGVYADLENGMIRLEAAENVIYLEDEVLHAFEQYVAFLREEARRARVASGEE